MSRRRPTSSVDDALARAATAIDDARRRSRSRATSTPTATRSARCSALLPRAARRRARRRRVVPDAVRRSRRTTASCPGSTCSRRPSEFPAEPDVMVTFDCGSLGAARRPRAAGRRRRDELIVIDHHISNDRYGTINVIEPDAAASGCGRAPADRRARARRSNRDAAVCLYAALVCDTGRFQYETTTPEVFELARRARRVRRAGRARCRARCSRSTASRTCSCSARRWRTRELVREQRFVWTAVTQEMLDAPRRRRSRRSRASSTSCAAPPRPRSRACSRRRPTARCG